MFAFVVDTVNEHMKTYMYVQMLPKLRITARPQGIIQGHYVCESLYVWQVIFVILLFTLDESLHIK